MDNRPIGVFDSGLGGLTAVRELRALLPHEHIVYFGDTGRVPYGSRSRETIIKYARQDVNFLLTFDLKAIMIACGTASTTALDTVAREYDLPIFGVVEPASREAGTSTRSGRIGLIGTPASVRSGAYERAILACNPAARVTEIACPLLVPLVENGRFSPGDPLAELVVAEYLAPLKQAQIDTLVLGCTHYPLLSDTIGACMGPEVTLIDSGGACARHAVALLTAQGALADREQPGECRYFVSDRPDDFSRLAALFLGRHVAQEVTWVEIEQY